MQESEYPSEESKSKFIHESFKRDENEIANSVTYACLLAYPMPEVFVAGGCIWLWLIYPLITVCHTQMISWCILDMWEHLELTGR